MSSSEPTSSEERCPLLADKGEGQDSSTETENNPGPASNNTPPPASGPTASGPTASGKESQESPSASKDGQPETNSSKTVSGWVASFFRSTSEYTTSKGSSVDKDRKYWETLPLEEKRRHYTCRQYVRLEDIKPWSQEKIVLPKKKSKAPARVFPVDSFPVNQSLNDKISLWRGDITSLEIDAIVNAANTSLMGGGGVDGAIHRAASSSLRAECGGLDPRGCDPGDARVTGGHRLPAKYIIHTVGPMNRRRETLESCYNTCLKRVKENDIQSVAFCCISTGVYGYPNEEAAHIALGTVREWLDTNSDKVERIIFCVFLDIDVKIYSRLLHLYFPREKMEEAKEESEEAANKESSVDMSEDEWDNTPSPQDAEADNSTPPPLQEGINPAEGGSDAIPPLKRNVTEPARTGTSTSAEKYERDQQKKTSDEKKTNDEMETNDEKKTNDKMETNDEKKTNDEMETNNEKKTNDEMETNDEKETNDKMETSGEKEEGKEGSPSPRSKKQKTNTTEDD